MKEKYIHGIGILKSDFHISDFLRDQIVAGSSRFNQERAAPPMKESDSRMKKELQFLRCCQKMEIDIKSSLKS